MNTAVILLAVFAATLGLRLQRHGLVRLLLFGAALALLLLLVAAASDLQSIRSERVVAVIDSPADDARLRSLFALRSSAEWIVVRVGPPVDANTGRTMQWRESGSWRPAEAVAAQNLQEGLATAIQVFESLAWHQRLADLVMGRRYRIQVSLLRGSETGSVAIHLARAARADIAIDVEVAFTQDDDTSTAARVELRRPAVHEGYLFDEPAGLESEADLQVVIPAGVLPNDVTIARVACTMPELNVRAVASASATVTLIPWRTFQLEDGSSAASVPVRAGFHRVDCTVTAERANGSFRPLSASAYFEAVRRSMIAVVGAQHLSAHRLGDVRSARALWTNGLLARVLPRTVNVFEGPRGEDVFLNEAEFISAYCHSQSGSDSAPPPALMLLHDVTDAFWATCGAAIERLTRRNGVSLVVAGVPRAGTQGTGFLPAHALRAEHMIDRRPEFTVVFDASRLGEIGFEPSTVTAGAGYGLASEADVTRITPTPWEAQTNALEGLLSPYSDPGAGAGRFVRARRRCWTAVEPEPTAVADTDFDALALRQSSLATRMHSATQWIEGGCAAEPYSGAVAIPGIRTVHLNRAVIAAAYPVRQVTAHHVDTGSPLSALVSNGSRLLVLQMTVPASVLNGLHGGAAPQDPLGDLLRRVPSFPEAGSFLSATGGDTRSRIAGPWRSADGRAAALLRSLASPQSQQFVVTLSAGGRLSERAQVARTGAPLRFQLMRADEADGFDRAAVAGSAFDQTGDRGSAALPPLPLWVVALRGAGYVHALAYSPFDGEDLPSGLGSVAPSGSGASMIHAQWLHPRNRIYNRYHDASWTAQVEPHGPQRVLDVARLIEDLEPLATDVPRLSAIRGRSDGALVFVVSYRAAGSRPLPQLALCREPGCVGADHLPVGAAKLTLEQVEPESQLLFFALSAADARHACGNDKPCLRYVAGRQIYLQPTTDAGEVSIGVLDRLRLLAAVSGGRFGQGHALAPTPVPRRRHLAWLAAFLVGLAWAYRAATRVLALRARRSLAAREIAALLREQPSSALLLAGDLPLHPSAATRTGVPAARRPIEPGDRLGAIVPEDALAWASRRLKPVPRVIPRMIEVNRHVAILIVAGTSTRQPSQGGRPPKLLAALQAASLVARLALARGDRVAARVLGCMAEDLVLELSGVFQDHEWDRFTQTVLAATPSAMKAPSVELFDGADQVVYISDLLEEDLRTLERVLGRAEDQGAQTASVHVYSEAEWRDVGAGWLPRRGITGERWVLDPAEVRDLYERRQAEIHQALIGLAGGVVSLRAGMPTSESLAMLLGSSLRRLLES